MTHTIKPFEHVSVPRIVFGRGVFARVGELFQPLGRCALIVSNASTPLINHLREKLSAAGVTSQLLRQSGEPTTADVDRAVQDAAEHACTALIGIGGGSAIDLAKAAAGLLTNGGTAIDYMEVVGKGQKFQRPAAPWMAIPCTAGTGAEVTRNAVIGYHGNDGQAFKASLRSEHLLASVVLVDPELTLTVRPEVTARTGMDALCQCMEAYTSTGATAISDPLALDGVARAARSLLPAYHDGSNIAAREDMALAALFSGIALTNAGLGAVHGFAAPMGAVLPIPHGTLCAALLPHVIAANIHALQSSDPQHPTLARYAALGRLFQPSESLAVDAALAEVVAFTRRLAQDLHIPPLRSFGLTEENIPTLAALTQKASSMRYNPIPLPLQTLQEILRATR